MVSSLDAYWVERRGENENRNNDFRTQYQRDYARIVHSAAFRRLQAKTQILGIGDSDFYRTRLTHSMEASQVGEAIVKKLHQDCKEDEELCSILPPSILIRTICLAHDFGHPPFGHGGEIALNRCMLAHGGFEGNGQTLRIITDLESYHEKYGMNLTRRTVLGVIKYPARYSDMVNWRFYPKGSDAYKEAKEQGCSDEEAINRAKETVSTDLTSLLFVADNYKPPKCYLDTEHSMVMDWIARDISDWEGIAFVEKAEAGELHGKTMHKSLDSSIMEIADDIAYGIHDLEDAINLKFVDQRLFKKEFKEELLESLLFELFEKQDNKSYKNWLGLLFSDETFKRKRIIGQLVNYCLQNVYLDRVSERAFDCPLFNYRAKMKSPAKEILEKLKKFVVRNMIKQTSVQQLEFKRQKLVTELFHVFAMDPKRLLERRQYKKTTKAGGPIQTERVICDYIAGMTDEYATKRYQQLFEPRTGSVFDRL